LIKKIVSRSDYGQKFPGVKNFHLMSFDTKSKDRETLERVKIVQESINEICTEYFTSHDEIFYLYENLYKDVQFEIESRFLR
jgi:hypothetical protein